MTMEEIKEPLMGDEEMPPLLEDQETDTKLHCIALFVEPSPFISDHEAWCPRRSFLVAWTDFLMVNNVAFGYIKPVLEVTQEEYKHIMNTNLEADFHLSQLAHTLLKASGQGNIIFISLIAGLEGYSSLYVYGSSKATLKQLQKLSPEFHCAYFGLFDDHGGKGAIEFASKKMGEYIVGEVLSSNREGFNDVD
ncbi:hypothetical protein ZIOFF_070985 [Zingiber officinale]|uniref:Uncharacterized protein n=1 Tax=Zingiber officinale TaxID=94328 RepID=A0A8J5ENE2_ZINOF|nr:hypothetical protein ZIOFF_070985 [Zingiber officinale]